MPISQNVTIKHFPLSSFSTNFPCRALFQTSLTSLSDPPPYPRSILPSSMGSTLQGNFFPLFIFNLPLYLIPISQLCLPFLSTSQPFSSNLFSIYGLLILSTILNQFMLLAIPLALSHLLPFQLSLLAPSLPLPIPFLPLQPLPASPDQVPVAPQKGDPPEVGREAGEDVTPITPPEDLILKPLLLIPLLLLIWTFPPQTLPGLVSPSIFVLMVPWIFLPGPGLLIILMGQP